MMIGYSILLVGNVVSALPGWIGERIADIVKYELGVEGAPHADSIDCYWWEHLHTRVLQGVYVISEYRILLSGWECLRELDRNSFRLDANTS